MRTFLAAFVVSLVAAGSLCAQSYRNSEFDSLYALGVHYTDNGEMEKAWEVYETGRKKYPETSIFRYEQGYIRCIEKRYEEAKKILLEIINAKDADDHYYQVLGNIYDFTGDPKKAIETYKAGLKKFPESGHLYLELGVMAGQENDYATALGYWEQGLTVQPSYSSNFFHAGRVYMATQNRGWGLLYGEIFLNLEFSTERSSLMRKMLWSSYGEAFTKGGEKEEVSKKDAASGATNKLSLGGVSFFSELTMYFDDTTKTLYMPFPMYFEKATMLAALPVLMDGGEMTIKKLHTFRSSMIDQWFSDSSTANAFNITLFDYLRQLKNAGLLEPYDYFLFFCDETEDEVQQWADKHPGELEKLGEWLGAHPYPTDKESAFSQLRIKGIPLNHEDKDGDK